MLLDQEVIAGVGNIYADEALYRSRIRPHRLSMRVSTAEATALAKAIREILQLAIKKMGTTFDSYSGVNGNPGEFSRYLKVYNRGGLPCRRCGGTIKKIRAAGRGTHYCPKCQR
jgi:formamidopyrimidine-DNA glycosylase